MKKQVWSLVLVTALLAGSLSPDMASAKKKQPSLAKSKVSLSFYGNTASAKVKVKNIAKNAKVTISQPKKTKKLLRLPFWQTHRMNSSRLSSYKNPLFQSLIILYRKKRGGATFVLY